MSVIEKCAKAVEREIGAPGSRRAAKAVLSTLAADLDEGALNAAENAIIPILKDPDSGYFEILRAAIQAYLSALSTTNPASDK